MNFLNPLYSDLGAGIRVYCIAAGRINAPHGYIYRVHEDGTVYVARLVHLARYLSDLPEGRSKERVRGTTRIAQQPLHDHCRQARTYKRKNRGVSFR